MATYNRITAVGRLTADPELKELKEDSKVVNFTIAVDRPTKDETTDFFRCFAWNKLAEIVAEYGEKGRLVLVGGRLEQRTYEKEGQKHTVAEIRVEDFQLLDSKKSGSKDRSGMPASESQYVKDIKIDPDEDLPF